MAAKRVASEVRRPVTLRARQRTHSPQQRANGHVRAGRGPGVRHACAHEAACGARAIASDRRSGLRRLPLVRLPRQTRRSCAHQPHATPQRTVTAPVGGVCAACARGARGRGTRGQLEFVWAHSPMDSCTCGDPGRTGGSQHYAVPLLSTPEPMQRPGAPGCGYPATHTARTRR